MDEGRAASNNGRGPIGETGAARGGEVADLYLKALESERKRLWATSRLKGLAADTPERRRIAELDALLREHKARPRA